MSALKARIQETLRTMSTSFHPHAEDFRPNLTPVQGLMEGGIAKTRGGPRRRKRWRTKHPLRELRLLRGFTLEELADKTQMSPSYLSRLESGSRRLNVDIINKLSGALNCHPSDLLPCDGQEDMAVTRFRTPGAIKSVPDKPDVFQTLPLYHLSSTPDGVQTIDFAHPTEWVPRPSELSEVSKAYAVSMPTNAMSPRYYAGERLLVHPTKILTQKCFVVVATKNGHVMIGQFSGWRVERSHDNSSGPLEPHSEDKMALMQLESKGYPLPGSEQQGQETLIPRHLIASVARIVGSMEAA